MSRIDMEELLDRYLKGEASPAEAEKVESWLNAYQHTTTGWQEMDKTGREQWLSDLYPEIEGDAGIGKPKVIVMQPQRKLWRSLAAIAAVVAVFFTVYLVWPISKNAGNSAALTALTVASGQETQVSLADGSKIWVNSLSEFKYPRVFNRKTREVYLSGEAYFDIVHDPSRPFIIHTGKVITTVLGTAFNIKEDKQNHTVVVTVTRGKVSVANGSQPLGVITPNQQISFNEVNGQHSQNNIEAEKVIAWQENYIHFNDISFADAARQLQARFKVKISFANDNVKKCRFTGTALKDEKLDNILKVICAINDASYKTKPDGSIVIDGPGCN